MNICPELAAPVIYYLYIYIYIYIHPSAILDAIARAHSPLHQRCLDAIIDTR